MKRLLIAIIAFVASITGANAQHLTDIAFEASYITDKMVFELGLTNVQRNSILQLNLNYLNSISSYRDINSKTWKKRNRSLKKLLTAAQWHMYKNANYFYRPIGWRDGAYTHNIYAKYPRHNYDCKMPPPRPRNDKWKGDNRHPDKMDKGPRGNHRGKDHKARQFGSRR